MTPSPTLVAEIRAAIDNKTKPLGALGRLEDVAARVALRQGTVRPRLVKPTVLVFAGDHGVAAEGVSAYPSDVTWQMVLNFLHGGAAINVFARCNGLNLKVVDAGVAHDFGDAPGLLHRKQGPGSANFRRGPALTPTQLDACLADGAALIDDLAAAGTNVVGFGEMGIGNTSAAAMLMSAFCGLPPAECAGRGTGLDDAALAHKARVLTEAADLHGRPTAPRDVLLAYAGLEMAMMCGAMLRAHERGMLLLIDGFIVTAVLAAAAAMQPDITEACLFAHSGDEQGHGRLLAHLGAQPLLQLGLRLGEGTGAALAYPLVAAAVAFLNEMASFDQAGVSKADA